MVVNPGSVGLPAFDDDTPRPHRVCAGSPHASYMILDRQGADWAVTHRLVARRKLDETMISELTRLLFALRLTIATEAPAAHRSASRRHIAGPTGFSRRPAKPDADGFDKVSAEARSTGESTRPLAEMAWRFAQAA